MRLVDGKLSKDDETSIEELHQYLIEGEGSWALGDGIISHILFFNKEEKKETFGVLGINN